MYRLDGVKGHTGPWLRVHHLVYLVSYQSGGRFWLFQGVEAALLLGVARLSHEGRSGWLACEADGPRQLTMRRGRATVDPRSRP